MPRVVLTHLQWTPPHTEKDAWVKSNQCRAVNSAQYFCSAIGSLKLHDCQKIDSKLQGGVHDAQVRNPGTHLEPSIGVVKGMHRLSVMNPS